MTTCPHCGSSDLEAFADDSGHYCYGCWSNVFPAFTEEQWRDIPGNNQGPSNEAWLRQMIAEHGHGGI